MNHKDVNNMIKCEVEKMEPEHYDATVKCLNCGNQWNECVSHGLLVSEYIKERGIFCLNCKCPDAKIVGRVTC